MVVYELTHLFFRFAGELVYDPKGLGLYSSRESVEQAICYYSTQPDFCDNKNAFSFRERIVLGAVADDTVYKALVYLHSADYEFKAEIELGLYGGLAAAQNELYKYCSDNAALLNSPDFICKKIVNKCMIGRREWPEGFSVSD